VYIEADSRLLCKDCGHRPDYYGVPLHLSLAEAFQTGPVDPRFGASLGDGWTMKIGDKEVPVRLVKYNPDGDPGQSYEPPKPKTTDGEE
jgi:hypothetical protein